jgi:thiol-disulfide isomerase/thioredoxin
MNRSALGFVCGALLVLFLEVGAALLVLGGFDPAEDAIPAELPAMTRLGDLQGSFANLQGHDFTFADLRGKIVILNLWATWCPPCLMEMPSLERLWKHFEPGGKVVVLCLSEERAEDVRSHRVSNMAMPLHVFTSPVPEELQAEGLPTTFIFDQEGRVIFGHTGMAKWDDPEIIAYLEALIAGKN